jgi:hypothetical protein
MMNRSLLSAIGILAVIATSLPRDAGAQAFTEFRDPLRGVTFYSVQISTDPMQELQHEGSSFASNDEMTLGLSAFFFDESDVVDDYVLWLRHDGPRRWFTGSKMHPLDVVIDGNISSPAPLHTLRSDAAEVGPFIEKLEFTLHPLELEKLISAESVALELHTLLGSLEKRLDEDEIEAIREFRDRVMALHGEIRISHLTQ